MWKRFNAKIRNKAMRKRNSSFTEECKSLDDASDLKDAPKLVFGSAERQGLRQSMEDRNLCISDLGVSGMGKNHSPQALVAVMDGHGGSEVSEWLQINIPKQIKMKLMEIATEFSKTSSFIVRDMLITHAIEKAFENLDQNLLKEIKIPSCGSCLTGALIIGTRLYVFNVGDSRTLLCRSGRIEIETKDHRPDVPEEWDRICGAGGLVLHGRVMGELAVSRAFGDFHLKDPSKLPNQNRPENSINERYPKGMMDRWNDTQEDGSHSDSQKFNEEIGWESPLILNSPDITVTSLTYHDEFLLLACDGLFDVIASEDVVEMARENLDANFQYGSRIREMLRLKESKCPARLTEQACEDLANRALLGGSQDNVTVVIVRFCHPNGAYRLRQISSARSVTNADLFKSSGSLN